MVTLADPRPAWRATLLADAAVLAAVEDRIYPSILPQNERRQSVTYQEISGQGDHHMQGASGLAQSRVQFNAWADNPDDAYDLALKVKAALDGYSGTVGGVTIKGVFYDSVRDLVDDEAKLHARSMDFIVWYAER